MLYVNVIFFSFTKLLSRFAFSGRSPRPTVKKPFKGYLRNKRSFYYNLDERNHKARREGASLGLTLVD